MPQEMNPENTPNRTPGKRQHQQHAFIVLCGISLTLVGLSVPAKAACNEPQNQTEMNICAAEEFKAADEELNRIYNANIGNLDASHKAALKKAQRTWIRYRDEACKSYSLQAEGGSMQPMLYNMCRTRLTGERSNILRDQFTEG